MRDVGTGSPAGESERLLRGLVELWGPGSATAGDSAQDYDLLHAQGHLCQRDSFYKWLLSLLKVRPGQTLLDISCGRGALLAFARLAGLRAIGLDVSPLDPGSGRQDGTRRAVPGRRRVAALFGRSL